MLTLSTGETLDLPLNPDTRAELDDNALIQVAFHGLAIAQELYGKDWDPGFLADKVQDLTNVGRGAAVLAAFAR